MTEQRRQFEELPEIKRILNTGKFKFSDSLNTYCFQNPMEEISGKPSSRHYKGYLEGAWYFYQMKVEE